MKVRVNSVYVYRPCLMDICDARTNLREGDIVRVINVRGCPPANTMGHCYVGTVNTGRFIGMVCTGSLTEPRAIRVNALRHLAERMKEETAEEQFTTADAINAILATFPRPERDQLAQWICDEVN